MPYQPTCRISFLYDWAIHRGELGLVPIVDGVALTELVGRYETGRGYVPTGNYAGLIPAHRWPDEPGEGYFYSQTLDAGPRSYAGTYVLGCGCGEAECWPLECTVTVEEAWVRWSGFAQPHRREWRYEGFGPFTFALEDYREEIAQALAGLKRFKRR